MNKQELGTTLINWYQKHKRDLPWRHTTNPYHIWVSEIMLQQTRVEAVIPYYYRFIEALPNIEALSQASDDQLRKLWQGLGYYRRVTNMKQAAIQCCQFYNGQLPSSYEQLLKLKGIGPYCASAIASFAFHLPHPVVDGNVIRVCSRLWCKDECYDTDKKKKELAQELLQIMPLKQCDLFNQAIMELGAMVCIPNGMPHCDKCPWQISCQAYHQNKINEYPILKTTKSRKIEKYTVVILQCGEQIHFVKRSEEGLLSGLYQFDMLEGFHSLTQIEEQFQRYGIMEIKQLPDKRHVFTHKEWELKTYWVLTKTKDDGLWVHRQQYEKDYALASAFESYLNCISF